MKSFWTRNSFSTLLGVVMSAIAISPAWAVDPAPITYNTRTDWSTPLYNEFDGFHVNDRHDRIGGLNGHFVSQWSRSGIRLTVRNFWVTGESLVPRTRYRRRYFYNRRTGHRYSRYIPYTDYQRVQHWSHRDISPDVIHFRINGEAYEYSGGEVPPDLAAALANAPRGNMTIRLEFQDPDSGRRRASYDVEIGAGTVAAWRQVFGEERETRSEN
ncbi:hypothetical protein K4A83_10295 [Spirulina subsalsa FACHB-351]|uniref:Uncharacterized protein n=1 Tax=Spirulina subsalsa FACHB-351 TaxID=234711 RepID=A0ABT3L576_9CYAN|nr:hypothetical protein [Spirulina subsalsa]MCW6036650.1 hypothetical protein [Spirulina subsalsa FACHB-351]